MITHTTKRRTLVQRPFPIASPPLIGEWLTAILQQRLSSSIEGRRCVVNYICYSSSMGMGASGRPSSVAL